MFKKEINTVGTDTLVGVVTLSERLWRQHSGTFSSGTRAFPVGEKMRVLALQS